MKKIVGVLCAVFSLFTFINSNVFAYAAYEETSSLELTYDDVIPEEVWNYVISNFEEITDIGTEYIYDFNISEQDVLFLGNPYIVVNIGTLYQDEVYYYPVISANKVVFVISIMGTDKGYTYGVQTELVDVLNEVDYINNPSVVYVVGSNLYIETEYTESIIYNYSELSQEEIDFIGKSFVDKFLYARKVVDNFRQHTDINEEYNDFANVKSNATLTLYKPMGQYGYEMCWASAVATIVNYIKSSTVTGFVICNRMGIGYNDGGTTYDAQDALTLYGINYKISSSALTWSSIENNIKDKKPIYVGLISSSNSSYIGHAVTIYGYSGTVLSNGKIYVWDSALDGGSGGYSYFTTSYYYTNGTGVIYEWATTASYE